MLKQNLDQIAKYQGDDIEVVISDDCSTDNIWMLIESYHDNRISYYRTEKNVGHDLNILHGIRCCKSNYVYVFRTRDNVFVENIPSIIKTLELYPDAGY